MQRVRSNKAAWVCALLPLVVAACTPALNWREWALPSTATVALFPCKATAVARELDLAGQRVTMHLHACDADDAVWAVAHLQLADPAQVAPALQALRLQAARHIGAAAVPVQAWAVPGATPNVHSGRVTWQGQLPDGRRVAQAQGLFVYGTQVFQATAMGAHLDPAALAAFFEGIRVRP